MDKNSIIRFFLPPKCMFCGDIVVQDNICSECANKAEYLKIPPYAMEIKHRCFKNIDRCISFYYYKDMVRDSILYAKYKSCDSFIGGFEKLMELDFEKFCNENHTDEIISMPAHKSKFYTYEYDLPQQMAACIAKNNGLRYNKDLVTKVKKTKNQHDLSLSERKNNLKDAFKLNIEVNGKNILIIDDIISTGYSLEEVAHCLKKGGASTVMAITFAYNKL